MNLACSVTHYIYTIWIARRLRTNRDSHGLQNPVSHSSRGGCQWRGKSERIAALKSVIRCQRELKGSWPMDWFKFVVIETNLLRNKWSF